MHDILGRSTTFSLKASAPCVFAQNIHVLLLQQNVFGRQGKIQVLYCVCINQDLTTPA